MAKFFHTLQNSVGSLRVSLQFVFTTNIAAMYDTGDILKLLLYCYGVLCMIFPTVYVFIVS